MRQIRFRRTGSTLFILAVIATLTTAAATAQTGSDPVFVTARHVLTLITGDVVDLTTTSDGQQAAAVRPAPGRDDMGFQTRTVGGQFYLVPHDAFPLLAAGRLDKELFNLTALVAHGYDDAASATLPLIVQYETTGALAALPGATGGFTLESINALAVREDKAAAGTFWAAARSGPVRKIWLNRTVTVALEDSVPQVGAPHAWAAGHDGAGVTVAVVDTGIDTSHPDLDNGKVVAAANFSTEPDVADHNGHGTHVASIVAGTGEAAPTVRKGVAPGAGLLNAKVFNKFGTGTLDAVIAGVEWAAYAGADVINLSLGTPAPASGPDAVTESIDAVSQETGALVVVAAGNLGSDGDRTIASPGWASEALTVGSGDPEFIDGFSSRGPRGGDFAIKPDIIAPGSGIAAARAEGSNLGPVIDGTYQELSGTSMATPHVAGAAAILAQRYPDHTNRQLKDLLVSTATTSPYEPVYHQGGGRLNVVRAHDQGVYASPGTLNLGYLRWPQTGSVTQTVTMVNDSAAAVTLELSLRMTDAPAGMFTLSAPTLVVPAEASATVDVTVDPTAGPAGLYGGYLVGEAGEVVVHTSVGAYVEPETYTVTVTGIARDGRPAEVASTVELFDMETGAYWSEHLSAGNSTVTFRAPPGTYSLAGYLGTADASDEHLLEMSLVTDPQLSVRGNTTVTLDARKTKRLEAKTRQPTATTRLTLSYHRGGADWELTSASVLPAIHGSVSPTTPVTAGEFEFFSKWVLVAPPLEASVTSPRRIPLAPRFLSRSRPVDGEHSKALVSVGAGRPADYAGRDVRGKVVLIRRTDEVPYADQVATAAAGGAWAALIRNDRPGLLGGDAGAATIPAFAVEQEPGDSLAALLRRGPVRLRVSGTSVSPYVYDLLLPEKHRVPTSVTYQIDERNTTTIDARYQADQPGTAATDLRHGFRPYQMSVVELARTVPRPWRRTEYVSANDTVWQHRVFVAANQQGEFTGPRTTYEPRTRTVETWLGRPSRPGATPFTVPAERTADTFRFGIYPHSDSGGHVGFSADGDVYRARLYAGDQLLVDRMSAPAGQPYRAVPEPATYRLELSATRSIPGWTYATATNTTWTFRSSQPPSGETVRVPLLQVDYEVPLDQYNRACCQGFSWFTLRAGHVPGVDGPPIASVAAWSSADDGRTWQPVWLLNQGNGVRVGAISHTGPSDAVSLRVTATDTAGNSIDQTILRAYGRGR